MKKLVRLFRRWRYRRLYKRLFWRFITKTNTGDEVGYQAACAFEWLTGRKWKDVL